MSATVTPVVVYIEANGGGVRPFVIAAVQLHDRGQDNVFCTSVKKFYVHERIAFKDALSAACPIIRSILWDSAGRTAGILIEFVTPMEGKCFEDGLRGAIGDLPNVQLSPYQRRDPNDLYEDPVVAAAIRVYRGGAFGRPDFNRVAAAEQ